MKENFMDQAEINAVREGRLFRKRDVRILCLMAADYLLSTKVEDISWDKWFRENGLSDDSKPQDN